MSLFTQNRKGASSGAPDSTQQPLPKRRTNSLWVVRIALFSLVCVVAGWGVLHHPAYEEFTLSRLDISQFPKLIKSHMDDPMFLYQLGRKLNEKERYSEADPFLRRAVGISPDNPKYRDEWARALLGSGLTSAAYGQLREFAGKNESLPEAHLNLGKFYVTQNSMIHAKEELDRTVQLNPKLGEAWAYLSVAENSLGNEEKARDASKKAVELRPDNAGDHLIYAQFLIRANDLKQAKEMLTLAKTLAPNKSDVHRGYADFLLTYGTPQDYPVALEEAQKTVHLNPNDGSAKLLLGRAFIRTGNANAALSPLKDAVDLLMYDSTPALELSGAYRSLGRIEEASLWNHNYISRKKFEQDRSNLWEALRVSPQDVPLHKKLARLLGLHGDTEGCVRQYASAFHCANDSPSAMIPAASDLCEGGFAKRALPLAQRAVEVANSSPKAHQSLGDALLATGQVHQAGLEYDKVVGWNPEQRESLKKKLQSYVDEQAKHPSPAELLYRTSKKLAQETVGPRQMTPAVEELARKAVELDAQNPKYTWFLMEVQIAQKKKEAAILTARRLLKLAPGDSRGNALLGVLLAEKSNSPIEFEEADRYLKRSSLDPLVEATYRYGKGILALRQGKGAVALKELTLSVELDPKSDIGLYQLAQAQKLTGKLSAAEKTMSVFTQRQAQKLQLIEVLGDVSQQPNRLELYEKAAKLYDKSGLPEQAKAIRKAASERHLL